MNAPAPSVLHTFRTQSKVELYFWPSAGENPSVCIRDLIISMGYITAQSYRSVSLVFFFFFFFEMSWKMNTCHVACRGAEEDGLCWADLISLDAFRSHFALHELFVRPEVHRVARGFTPESDDLAFVDSSYTALRVNLLDSVPRPCVLWVRRRLCL